VHWVHDYEQTLAEKCVPVGRTVNTNIACVTQMMCADTEEEALRWGLEGGNFFGYSLGHYYIFGEHEPGKTDVWAEFVERRAERGYSPEIDAALESERLGAKIAAGDTTGLRGATGTPAQIREYLRRFEGAGIDQIIFVMQAGKNRHEHICESLEKFGTEVLPEFKERDAAQVAAKAERLAPVVEAALARRPEPGPALPDGFSFPALPVKMIGDNADGKAWLRKFAEDQAIGEATLPLG
jgi:hypothetical protein